MTATQKPLALPAQKACHPSYSSVCYHLSQVNSSHSRTRHLPLIVSLTHSSNWLCQAAISSAIIFNGELSNTSDLCWLQRFLCFSCWFRTRHNTIFLVIGPLINQRKWHTRDRAKVARIVKNRTSGNCQATSGRREKRKREAVRGDSTRERRRVHEAVTVSFWENLCKMDSPCICGRDE